jgi:hypothetical protein
MDVKLGQGAAMIFNVPPNSSGIIPEEYVAQLAAVGAAEAAMRSNPAASLSASVSAPCGELSITVPVTGPFDRVVSAEGLEFGQAIANYSIEVFFGDAWSALPVHGATVGLRIQDDLSEPIVGAVALRFNCTASLPPPMLGEFVNSEGNCLGFPPEFPCWRGPALSANGTGGSIPPASLLSCPLVAVPCAGSAQAWYPQAGAVWRPQALPGTETALDCQSCAIGSVATLIAEGMGTPLLWNPGLYGGRIAIPGCSGVCLSNGISGGATAPCGETGEPWSSTQLHVEPCVSNATAGWRFVPVPLPEPLVTLKVFSAVLRVSPESKVTLVDDDHPASEAETVQ